MSAWICGHDARMMGPSCRINRLPKKVQLLHPGMRVLSRPPARITEGLQKLRSPVEVPYKDCSAFRVY